MIWISSSLCIKYYAVIKRTATCCHCLTFIKSFSILVLSFYMQFCYQMLELKEACYHRPAKSQQKPVAIWSHIWLKNSKCLPRMKARKCAKRCKRYISFCYLFVCFLAYPFTHFSFTCLLVYLFTCLLVYLFTCLLVYLFTCLLVYLFTCFLVYLFPCLLVSLLACLLICL